MFGFFSREKNIAYRALREHLAETELTLDQQVKYFDTLSRANSNAKIAVASIGAACITAIVGIIGAFLIREYESNKIRREECAIPAKVQEYIDKVDAILPRIDQELKYVKDHYDIHHKASKDLRSFLQSLREKQFFAMDDDERLREIIEGSRKPKS